MSRYAQSQVEYAFANIERWNTHTNALLLTSKASATEKAIETDQCLSAGNWCGLLAGLTISLKDNIDWVGTPTTAASIIRADHFPQSNAFIVDRLLSEGALIVGKANLHEWVFGPTSQSKHFGPVKNPWDPNRFAGGSSGGSGVSVATGMNVVSIGSDTGGSIRIPAAFNGVAGLRPTIGRISRQGSVGVSARFDSLGPLARRVSDIARVFAVIAGHDPEDPFSCDVPVSNVLHGLDAPVQGMRIGVMRRWFFDDIHPELKASLERAIATYRELGVDVVEVDVGDAENAQEMLGFRLILADAFALHQEQLKTRRADYGEDLLIRYDIGKSVTGAQYADALRWTEKFRLGVDRVLQSVDALLHPTTPGPAPEISGMDYAKAIRAIPKYTCVYASAGLPSLALPCGHTTQGLPLSMELAGAAFNENKLLKLGHAFQKVTDFHLREPESYVTK